MTPPRKRIAYAPKTEKGLRDALDTAGRSGQPRRVTLGASIRPTAALYVPENVELVPGLYGFEGDQRHPLVIDGPLTSNRVPVFYGYQEGQVKGLFGGDPVPPEWFWPEDDDEAKIIRMAVQAGHAGRGHIVSLAGRRYQLRSDIPMDRTRVHLIGAGDAATILHCMEGWKPTAWSNADEWAHQPDGNHACVVRMGSPDGNDCFQSIVQGLAINCTNASLSNWEKYVSGIGGNCVQENSGIFRVGVEGASGCAVGFHRHDGQMSALNGLVIDGLWATLAMKADTVFLLFSPQSNNTVVRSFTIDAALDQYGYDMGRRNPRVAIKAQGANLKIGHGHIENAQIGVMLDQAEGINSIHVEQLDFNHMMDGALQKWSQDGKHFKPHLNPENPNHRPRIDSGLFDYSCGVLVTSSMWPVNNYRDRMKIEGLYSDGQLSFLLRDPAAVKHFHTYDQGQDKNASSGGLLHYSRRDLWTPV